MYSRHVALTVALLFAAAPALAQAPGIRVQGTTNLAPLLKKASVAYEAANAGTTIAVKGTSSGAGIASLRASQIDVAASDVAVADPAFVDTTLGAVGFAFVANPEAGMTNLTRPQAIGIFAGKIKNWKEIGGHDCPITIISRDIGTGTRLVLEEQVAKTLFDTRIAKNATVVMTDVEQTPCALGYVASYFVGTHGSMVLTYEGVAPTPALIKDGTYKFATVEHLYIRKDASAQTRAFVATVAADKPLLVSFGIF